MSLKVKEDSMSSYSKTCSQRNSLRLRNYICLALARKDPELTNEMEDYIAEKVLSFCNRA